MWHGVASVLSATGGRECAVSSGLDRLMKQVCNETMKATYTARHLSTNSEGDEGWHPRPWRELPAALLFDVWVYVRCEEKERIWEFVLFILEGLH